MPSADESPPPEGGDAPPPHPGPGSVPGRAAAILSARLAAMTAGGVGLVLTARALGPDLFGLLPVLGAITAILIVGSDLGVGRATGVETARAIADDRPPGPVLRAGIGLRTALGGAGLVVALLLSAPLASLLGDPRLASLIRIGGVFVLVDGVLKVTARGMEGLRWSGRQALVIGTGGVLASLGGAAAAILLVSPAAVVWARAGGELLAAAGGLLLLRSALGGPRDPGVRRRLLGYGRHLLVATGSYVAFVQLDLLVVGGLLGSEAAGRYGVVAVLGERLAAPAAALAAAGAPLLAGSTGARAPDGPLVRRMVALTLAAYLPGAALLVCLADPAIPLLLGSAYRPAVPVLQVFGPVALLLALTVVLGGALDYAGRAKVRGRVLLGAAVANVVLDALLCPIWGIRGAAVASLLAIAPVVAVYLPLVLRRANVAARDLGPATVRATVTAGATAAAALATRAVLPAGWPAFLGATTAGLAAAAGTALLTGLVPGEGPDRLWPPAAWGESPDA